MGWISTVRGQAVIVCVVICGLLCRSNLSGKCYKTSLQGSQASLVLNNTPQRLFLYL